MKKHVGYTGYLQDGKRIVRRRPFQKELTPGRSRVHTRDYAEQFDWGRTSEGTKQLALAILLDWSVSESVALCLHKQFEKEVLAEFAPNERWHLSPSEIERTVSELRATTNSPLADAHPGQLAQQTSQSAVQSG
jgi:hypothetical protein